MITFTENNDYLIAGNQYVAIAINKNNPADAHYFTKDSFTNALDKAIAWASPGL